MLLLIETSCYIYKLLGFYIWKLFSCALYKLYKHFPSPYKLYKLPLSMTRASKPKATTCSYRNSQTPRCGSHRPPHCFTCLRSVKEEGQVLHCYIWKSLPFSPLSKIAWMKPPSTMLRTGFDFAQDRLRRIRDARRICSLDVIRAT